MSDRWKIRIGIIVMYVLTVFIFVCAILLAILSKWHDAARCLSSGVIVAILTAVVSRGINR